MTKRWPDFPPLTDEEEAEIQRQIAANPDTFEASDEELRRPYTFAEIFPKLAPRLRKPASG
jgi:hypothetical protein